MNFPIQLKTPSLAAFALAATAVSASADLTVAYDNPLIPTGLRPGDSFHLLFVSSTKIQRDLLDGSDDGSDNSTIGQWDAHANNVAAGSTVPEMAAVNWFAIVSVDDLSDGSAGIAAKDHAVVSAPVYRTDGVFVANDLSDMWDGSIAVTLTIDESGNDLGTGSGTHFEVWTGDASNYSSPGIIGSFPLGNGTESAQTGYANNLTAWHSYGGHVKRGPNDSRYGTWAASGIAYSDSGGQRTFRGELTTGTEQNTPDTDGDDLLDGQESNTGTWVSAADTGTDPLDADTDDDALGDGVETNTGTYVSETNTGTNPLVADTDSDGAGDWYEITASFTDPTVQADNPGLPYPLPDPDPLDEGVADKPVKVYIMAGQSNMVGIGYVNGIEPGSMDTITKRENKFPHMVDGGVYTARNDVLYRGVISAVGDGPLQVGVTGDRVGVEHGFGHVMGWFHDEPVLLLKTSEGNRSLGWDFLAPGSPQIDYTDGKTYAGYGESPEKWTTGTTPTPGTWYAGKQYDECFLDEGDWADASAGSDPVINAADVLASFDTHYSDWAAQGYEIAGFVWWQGHKDQYAAGHYGRYEENMVSLINALRTEFNAPNAPFVVASIGFDGGGYAPGSAYGQIHAAQMAVGDPVDHPELAGTVASVDTTGYWRTTAASPETQGFHYNNNAETYTLVGDAMGRAMITLLDDEAPPSPDPMTFDTAPTAVNVTTVGMTATVASDLSGAVTTGGTNTFTFTHPQSDSPADDVSAPVYSWSLTLQGAFNLSGETENGTTATFASPQLNTPTAGTTTVTATIIGTVPDKLFVDVGVTQVAP